MELVKAWDCLRHPAYIPAFWKVRASRCQFMHDSRHTASIYRSIDPSICRSSRSLIQKNLPVGHLHSYVRESICLHWPSFLHGDGSQGMYLFSQFLPVYPGLHWHLQSKTGPKVKSTRDRDNRRGAIIRLLVIASIKETRGTFGQQDANISDQNAASRPAKNERSLLRSRSRINDFILG